MVHIDQSLVIGISGNSNDCSVNRKKKKIMFLFGMGGWALLDLASILSIKSKL